MLGLDGLGFGHKNFPKKLFIKHFPQGWAFGVFDDSVFGEQQKAIRKLLDTGKVAALRVHLNWDANHGLITMENLKRRLPKWVKLQEDYSEIPFYMSHSCEHNSRNKKEIERRLRYMADTCSVFNLVNSVQKGMHVSMIFGAGYAFSVCLERHGSTANLDANIVSLDGEVPLPNLKDYVTIWNREFRTIFLWMPEFNLRSAAQKIAPPIKNRTIKFTERQLKNLIELKN